MGGNGLFQCRRALHCTIRLTQRWGFASLSPPLLVPSWFPGHWQSRLKKIPHFAKGFRSTHWITWV